MVRRMKVDRYQHDFKFTRGWFETRNLTAFRDNVHPKYTGKPTHYLEIGVFEGMSLVWMHQHVLTHPKSKSVGIDPWLLTVKLDPQEMENVYERAVHNMKPWADKTKLIRGNSAEVLRRMTSVRRKRRTGGYLGVTLENVDLCLVDGGHFSLQVLDDARLAWRLVKPGGWMLFDDVENDIPKGKDHVKTGMETFLKELKKDAFEIVWTSKYMVCVGKK